MAIAPSGRVLVTGGNGFLALHIINLLLRQGYLVRATVRSTAKGAPLVELFAAYGDKLQIAVVEDMTRVRLCFFFHACLTCCRPDALLHNPGWCI